MSASTPRSVLAELRRGGVVIEPAGDRLHIESPKGVLTPEIKKTLEQLKPDLLSRLSEEACILEMSLDEFERGGHAIEARVPWLGETLWFVASAQDVAILLAEGVARGRIWTASELRDLSTLPGVARDNFVSISRLKVGFGATIVSVEQDLGTHHGQR